MAWEKLKQISLADALVNTDTALEELEEVRDLINWPRLEERLSQIHNKRRGEKFCPPLMMFKTLLLQARYALSGVLPLFRTLN